MDRTTTPSAARSRPPPPPRRRPRGPIADPKIGHVPSGFLTRAELLRRSGITEREMKKILGQGLIKASKKSTRGAALYDSETVERIRRIRLNRMQRKQIDQITFTADEALDVFKRIRDGKTLDVIMIELRTHPYVLNAIAHEYEKMAGAIMLPKNIVDRINALPISGVTFPIASAEQILIALESASSEHVCSTCRRRPCSPTCIFCTREQIERRLQREADAAVAASASNEPLVVAEPDENSELRERGLETG